MKENKIETKSIVFNSNTLPLNSSEVKAELNFRAFSVNLFVTLDLNKLIYLSVRSKSHPYL